ncbi:MAG: hypothetical protein INQ03_01730 [Candidatus Heimdallarchaeota archaeon]|nr:hypothetical protein [Candidatus Heimdallarchaeota archaeon]
MDKNEIHQKLSNTSVELTYKFFNLPRSTITAKPSENEWCPLEILIHLRQVSEVYTERVKRMTKAEDGNIPHLHDYDETKMMSKVDLEEETPKSNIRAFMKSRSELLNMISFDDTLWENCKCDHEKKGVLSLKELLITLVERETKYLNVLESLLPE